MSKKKNKYYSQQKQMCRALGIKPPPKNVGFIKKFKWIYKELTK